MIFSGLLSKLFKTREKVARKVQERETERKRAEDPDWDPDDDFDDTEKPFLEHLDDLRSTLIKIVVTLLVVTILAFVFNKQLLQLMMWPLDHAFPDRPEVRQMVDDFKKSFEAQEKEEKELKKKGEPVPEKAPILPPPVVLAPDASIEDKIDALLAENAAMREGLIALDQKVDKNAGLIVGVAKKPPGTQTIKPTAYFISTLKLCFISGIVVSFPLLLFFIGEFVFPGLKKKEKKVILPSLAVGFGLFLAGALFCFFVVLPRVLQFFDEFAHSRGVEAQWTIEYYLSFASQLILVFGLCFELPVVVLALVKMGILNFTGMKNTFSYAVVIIFAVGAIITPTPDAFTLCLLAGPMILLYILSMCIAFFIERRERKLYPELYRDDDDDEEGDAWAWARDGGGDDDDGDDRPRGGSGGSRSSGGDSSSADSPSSDVSKTAMPSPAPEREEWNKDQHVLGWDEVLADDEHHYGEEPDHDPYHDDYHPDHDDEHDPYHNDPDYHGDEHGHSYDGAVGPDGEPSEEANRQDDEEAKPKVEKEKTLEDFAAEDEQSGEEEIKKSDPDPSDHSDDPDEDGKDGDDKDSPFSKND